MSSMNYHDFCHDITMILPWIAWFKANIPTSPWAEWSWPSYVARHCRPCDAGVIGARQGPRRPQDLELTWFPWTFPMIPHCFPGCFSYFCFPKFDFLVGFLILFLLVLLVTSWRNPSCNLQVVCWFLSSDGKAEKCPVSYSNGSPLGRTSNMCFDHQQMGNYTGFHGTISINKWGFTWDYMGFNGA